MILVKIAADMGYPMRFWHMGMLAHTGGRYIRLNGCHSRKVSPCRSIVAGDVHAKNMAKVALYFIMEKLREKMPMCRINTNLPTVTERSPLTLGGTWTTYRRDVAGKRERKSRLWEECQGARLRALR